VSCNNNVPHFGQGTIEIDMTGADLRQEMTDERVQKNMPIAPPGFSPIRSVVRRDENKRFAGASGASGRTSRH
jgi:hypothetical protein